MAREKWIAESGATFHMTPSDDLLRDVRAVWQELPRILAAWCTNCKGCESSLNT